MNSLEEHFANLSKWLKSHGVPDWDRVLFAEDLHVAPFSKQTIDRDHFGTLAEFSDRFEELLAEGHNWINLNGLGILDGTLIVAIEKPKANADSPTTAVNQSGPPGYVKDRNYNLEQFIEIRE